MRYQPRNFREATYAFLGLPQPVHFGSQYRSRFNDLSPYEKGREEQKISTIKNVYNDRVNDAKNLLSMGLKQIGVSVAASLGALVALSGATVVAPAVVAVGGFAAGAAGLGMINIYRTRSAGALADKEVENAKMLAVSRETSRRLKI